MQERGDIPWGRPTLPEIPVPPFGSREQWLDFVAMLAEHVALVATGGPVPQAGYTLAAVLQDHVAAWHSDFPVTLPPVVLRVAVDTFFPAPWTPHGLAAALTDVPWDMERPWQVSPGAIRWGTDPTLHAQRAADGSWTVEVSERGNVRPLAAPATDDDMVLLLMDQQRSHPYPFGWVRDAERLRRLQVAAEPVRAAWRRHADLPYLASWRE